SGCDVRGRRCASSPAARTLLRQRRVRPPDHKVQAKGPVSWVRCWLVQQCLGTRVDKPAAPSPRETLAGRTVRKTSCCRPEAQIALHRSRCWERADGRIVLESSRDVSELLRDR